MVRSFVRVLTAAFLVFFAVIFLRYPPHAIAGVSSFKDHMLHIDGEAQPQLFGAELQYFRLRGGTERNIPRETVYALWDKALDRLVEMHGNAISFYIPWDFHEYAPGKFDFDGTADDDGDGRADYPSRDVKTWFRKIEEHGIRVILARPGPYINAEWGFLGFGAIPLWFHQMYPDSHMRNPRGQKTAMYSYMNPDFLRHSKLWFSELYKQVLHEWIGPGKPVSFLQIDNETNFMWQTIYNHDYGKLAIAAYQDFLKQKYKSIEKLNRAHQRKWKKFSDIKAPVAPGKNLGEDRDWYRFQDKSIHVYLQDIRKAWEVLGVKEPNVLFTLAESYNAPLNGLLPNFAYRNDRGKTGMMTVNLYPKTEGTQESSLLNRPFKADHDVKAAESASDYYLGQRQEWVMGPEIQGGWWRGTEVSAEARRQTYLTSFGHGLKALFVYYFHEGNNWQYSWARDEIQPYFEKHRRDPRYEHLPQEQLPEVFWTELDEIVANNVIAGWSSRHILQNGGTHTKDLYFDAPLDVAADPKPHFELLKQIGAKIIDPYSRFLGSATELTDPVCLVKHESTNAPSAVKGLDSVRMNSDWAGGLVGYLLQVGINPKILHWGLNPVSEFTSCRLLVFQDNGITPRALIDFFKKHVNAGGTSLVFLSDSMLRGLGVVKTKCRVLGAPMFGANSRQCAIGKGQHFQITSPIYAGYNSETYAQMTDTRVQLGLLKDVLRTAKIVPRLSVDIPAGGNQITAFARAAVDGKSLLVTVKNGRKESASCRVKWADADPKQSYAVTRLLEESLIVYEGTELLTKGFISGMAPNGSDAFFVQPFANVK